MTKGTSVLDFMVIGLPRSGTTWAANWLTTDASHCVHDPLYTTHYADWDSDPRFRHGEGVLTGAACTGVWRWHDWLNDHPARKLLLHREEGEVNDSLRAIGLPELGRWSALRLSAVEGWHVRHTDLFDAGRAAEIWDYLLPGVPFNAARHRELVGMWVQPAFDHVTVDREVTQRLLAELDAAS